jgi:hypothetical protein
MTTPIINAPERFTRKVPSGNVPPNLRMIAVLRTYRASPPAAAPSITIM